MKLKTLIDLCLTEGIAENAGQICFDINKLNNYLNKTKKQLELNKKAKNEFFFQYPNCNIFIKRAFGMYNKILNQGFIIDNSNNSFDKTIKPILVNFYNSL